MSIEFLFALPAFGGDQFPSKPIRIIVPSTAGGSADGIAREIALLVSENLKQQIIIDNRPGAGFSIGTEMAALSPPDGYTVLCTISSAVAVNPHIYKTSKLDPLKQLLPFIITSRGKAILVVNSKSSLRSVADLIAAAKANPGGLTYATSGPGSPQHLMGERLKKLAGIDLLQVHYKGEAPGLTDLMGGQVDMAFGFPTPTLPHIESGKFRPLAVTSASRSTALPHIPTLAESGLTGYDESGWIGWSVPAGTPEPVVEKLYQAFHAAAMSAELRQKVEKRGGEPQASTRAEAVALMKSDYERYRKIVKELDIRVE
ncbi:MAG: tripartite tricarboxylate transporter substrate binding protein [Burkholderiales bacterium]